MTKHDYVNYRLNRAFEAFGDANLLAENDRWNTAINRLYYASFYAIIALLIKNDIQVHTHDGARNQFDYILLKPEKLIRNLEYFSPDCLIFD